MKVYKEDQGRLARMFAFWSLALLLLFGCNFANGLMVGVDALRDPISGLSIPIIGVDLSGAFLISLGIFLIGIVVLIRWQQKPKVADLLIDTEAELRKVTWPSMQEVINSSAVVIVFVTLLFGFLALTDWFLARVMRYLVLGGV